MSCTRDFQRSVVAWVACAAIAGMACGDDQPSVFDPPPARGSLSVSWSLRSPNGDEIACQNALVDEASVAIGGAPQKVRCGEPQVVRFDDLAPDRYPVLVRLLAAGGAVLHEKQLNATVSAETVTPVEVTFEIDPNRSRNGSLQLRWL